MLHKFKSFFYKHIKLYKLLADAKVNFFSRREKEQVWDDWKKHALSYPEDCLLFEQEDLLTIFTPKYRQLTLNTDDPRIFEGLNISLKALLLMKEKLDAEGIQFVVLLIPTKELVFSQWVNERNTVNDIARRHYNTLLKYEKAMWKRTKDYLQAEQINFVDTLPCLQQTVSLDSVQPYPSSPDGHPNHVGYAAIVACVQERIF